MTETLTQLFTGRFGERASLVAMMIAGLGVFVWLLGARFSRSILALVGAGLGAWVGVNLPRWYGWHFDGMALGMGGALVAGLAGYLLHTTWLGAALLVNAALLFGFTAWALLAGNAPWTPPGVSEIALGRAEFVQALWKSMPGDLPRVMPWVVAGAAVSAVTTSLFWPTAARSMSWSLIGLVLILGGGGVAMTLSGSAEGGGYLPTAAGARVALLWGLAVAGALVQWWSLPAELTPAQPEPRAKPVAKPAEAASSPKAGELVTGGAKA